MPGKVTHTNTLRVLHHSAAHGSHSASEPAFRAGLAAGEGAQRRPWAAASAEDSPLLSGPQVLDLIRHFCYLIFQPLRGESTLTGAASIPPKASSPPSPGGQAGAQDCPSFPLPKSRQCIPMDWGSRRQEPAPGPFPQEAPTVPPSFPSSQPECCRGLNQCGGTRRGGWLHPAANPPAASPCSKRAGRKRFRG